MNKRRGRRNQQNYLYSIFNETRNLRARMGAQSEAMEGLEDPFMKKTSEEVVFKKLTKEGAKEAETPLEKCKERIEEVRRIEELLMVQNESNWN